LLGRSVKRGEDAFVEELRIVTRGKGSDRGEGKKVGMASQFVAKKRGRGIRSRLYRD